MDRIKQDPPTKTQFCNYVRTKITVFHERQLRNDAYKNSKMRFLNVSVSGLSGRHHPALLNIMTSQDVNKMRPHIKMLCSDLYTYELKAKYNGGSPHCILCQEPSENKENKENIIHILTSCKAYTTVRIKILEEMKTVVKCSKSALNFDHIEDNPERLTQFILDCTSLNLPMRINNCDDTCLKIFKLSRDLCNSINRTRLEDLKNLQKS